MLWHKLRLPKIARLYVLTIRRDTRSNGNNITLSKNYFYKRKNRINKGHTFGNWGFAEVLISFSLINRCEFPSEVENYVQHPEHKE